MKAEQVRKGGFRNAVWRVGVACLAHCSQLLLVSSPSSTSPENRNRWSVTA